MSIYKQRMYYVNMLFYALMCIEVIYLVGRASDYWFDGFF